MVYRMFFLCLVGLSACGPAVLIDESHPLSETGWSYRDTMSWSFEVPDTMTIYNLLLTVEHTPDFSFQNTYVQIHTLFPAGEVVSQVVSLELQDQAGAWLGKCGDEKCTWTIPIQENAFFNQTGTHQIKLEQYMRQDSLPGILALRMRIEDSGEKRS